jgi:NAD(P)-dependent dehydrogenase (short-subunit alcohol dehydrogenase family)
MGVLTDKVVLITGVARGCGRVLAEAFSAEGAKVVGCDTDVDTDVDGGRATAATVHAAGGEMIFVEADVADDTAVRDLVAALVQTYGGLDCAVNNAGAEATGLIADSTDDVFDQLIAVNLKGLLSCLPHEIAAHANPRRWLDRQHVLSHERYHRRPGERLVCRYQGRRERADQGGRR